MKQENTVVADAVNATFTLSAGLAETVAIAAEMAQGLRTIQQERLPATHPGPRLAAAITGVAGPGGGSLEKPVGCVFFGWSDAQGISTQRRVFPGDRGSIQRQAAFCALSGLVSRLFRGS